METELKVAMKFIPEGPTGGEDIVVVEVNGQIFKQTFLVPSPLTRGDRFRYRAFLFGEALQSLGSAICKQACLGVPTESYTAEDAEGYRAPIKTF